MARRILLTLLLVSAVAGVSVPVASADMSGSRFHRIPAAFLDADGYHTCAILTKGRVRCWGDAVFGALGYGNEDDIGDTELPTSAGPVRLGAGRKARAIALGESHSCAILDNGRVRCWGYAADGRLGYGNEDNIGDGELPSAVGPVDLGAGRRAVAITAGEEHTCAILDDGKVRCWGSGDSGRLGYGNLDNVGDTETPGSVGPVFLGTGRKARAIGAGGYHTCALLDNGRVRCWGDANVGQLGSGNMNDIGDNETPGSVAPVSLGRKAIAIAVGEFSSCAILDNGKVRCWGEASSGQLGLGNQNHIGDNELPTSVPPVGLGAGRRAIAVAVGYDSACVLLDSNRVRCWGYGGSGNLGYGATDDIGDNELPTVVGTVNLGPGRSARAIAVGWEHTCALLDNGRLRCWGDALRGELGYGNTTRIGDNETPNTAGPVSLGALIPRKASPSVSLRIRPRRDFSYPYRLRASGTLTGFLVDSATCQGAVVVRATRASQSVSKRAFVRRAGDRCSYSARLSTGFGSWSVRAKFLGNGSLKSDRSGSRAFRAG
jgi:alpha-tubulin suppressor-like RCC1 family protein